MGVLSHMYRLTLCALLLSACAQQPVSYIEPDQLVGDIGSVVLGFDLRSGSQPTATLVVGSSEADERSFVWLPFPGVAARLGGSLVGGVGSYSDYTLVMSASPRGASGELAVFLRPTLWPSPDGAFNLRQLPGNLYFIREGVSATFLYRLNTFRGRSAWEARYGLESATRDVDTIAVALPSGSEWREVAPGRTSIPDMIGQVGDVRLFPATVDEGDDDFLQVKYIAPTSSTAQEFATVATKVLGSLLVPFLTLVLVPGDLKRKPTLRRWAIPLLIIAQICVVGFLVWIGISSGFRSLIEVSRDLIPILSGAIAQVLVLKAKQSEKTDEFTRA